ncbi:MAG TPA: hypothetical protein EYO07_04300 [Candidatus Marinimicrobia bacterium]|nr:hypothetical protein [Candidatus Neomarinimicrobiota bacterium]
MKLFWLIHTLIFMLSCADEDLDSDNNIFNYNGFDSLGVRINTGELKLIANGLDITGEWHLTMIGNVQNAGNQFSAGSLSGFVTDNVNYNINLNPQMADNNVFLEGILAGDSINGNWNWSTFIGITNSGTFTAVR